MDWFPSILLNFGPQPLKFDRVVQFRLRNLSHTDSTGWLQVHYQTQQLESLLTSLTLSGRALSVGMTRAFLQG